METVKKGVSGTNLLASTIEDYQVMYGQARLRSDVLLGFLTSVETSCLILGSLHTLFSSAE